MLRQYVVDAFAGQVFSGNPAAVCLADRELSDALMQAIAGENKMSETAFLWPRNEDSYLLRWFTPGGEIDLCGHATLASAFVVFQFLEPEREMARFSTRSGVLTVQRRGALLEMDFPAYPLRPVAVTDAMAAALGARPERAFLGRDLLCVFSREETVRKLCPHLQEVEKWEGLLLHVTASGKDYDCVSRSFAPKLQVPEDPVCGSGHCHIVPYWAGVLKKREFTAYQASSRGGVLHCRIEGDRVFLGGTAVLFAKGDLYV